VLNWSEKRTWKKSSLAPWAFRAVKGERNFNPMMVMFWPFRRVRTFRFWSAFQKWKHGNHESVEQLRVNLLLML
jgi:hypothetical protein